MSVSKKSCLSVFWNFDQCPVPGKDKTLFSIEKIRAYAKESQFEIKNICVVGLTHTLPKAIREDLKVAGATIADPPSPHSESLAPEFCLQGELLKFVLDNPPPHRILLLIGDSVNLAGSLHILSNKRYEIIIVHNLEKISPKLESSALKCIPWKSFLEGTVSPDPPKESSAPKSPVAKEQPTKDSPSKDSKPLKSSNSQEKGLSQTNSKEDKPKKAKDPKAQVFQPLKEFLKEEKANGKQKVEPSEVGKQISFEKEGFKSLHEYLAEAEKTGVITIHTEDANLGLIYVSLKTNPEKKPKEPKDKDPSKPHKERKPVVRRKDPDHQN